MPQSPRDDASSVDLAISLAAKKLMEEVNEDDHPSEEALLDYYEGQSEDASSRAIQQHLLHCQECRQEVLGLQAFDLDVPEDSPLLPSEAETLEDQAEFLERISREPDRNDRAVHSATPLVGKRNLSQFLLRAASLAFFLAGAAFWILSLQRDSRSSPEIGAGFVANPAVIDLVRENAGQIREAQTADRVRVPPEANPLVLRLHLGDQTPHDRYWVEVFDANQEAIWLSPGLARKPTGSFAILVERKVLRGGPFRIDLHASSEGTEYLLATYRFDLSE